MVTSTRYSAEPKEAKAIDPLGKILAERASPQAVPADDVLEALHFRVDQFRSEGGWINRGKLRAAILHPENYLPENHWLRAAKRLQTKIDQEDAPQAVPAAPSLDLFRRLGLSSEQEWRGFRNGWNACRVHGGAAPQAVDAPVAPDFLRDFIELCELGDITEDMDPDDGLGWQDLLKRAKAMLASPTPAPKG